MIIDDRFILKYYTSMFVLCLIAYGFCINVGYNPTGMIEIIFVIYCMMMTVSILVVLLMHSREVLLITLINFAIALFYMNARLLQDMASHIGTMFR
ncbi:MAG: hypothetical protein WCF85_05250 [Rhodospirillaceae bacterium]